MPEMNRCHACAYGAWMRTHDGVRPPRDTLLDNTLRLSQSKPLVQSAVLTEIAFQDGSRLSYLEYQGIPWAIASRGGPSCGSCGSDAPRTHVWSSLDSAALGVQYCNEDA